MPWSGLPRVRNWGTAGFLVLLVAAAFAPQFLGYHFLPFGRYASYTKGLAESMGTPPAFEERYLERYIEHPWIYEPEPAWFTLYIPQGLYTAAQLREGRIPLWDPYTGCGTPTFDSGYFRPFDPFKLPFYLIPTLWTYAFGLSLLLAFGTWGAWVWLREEGVPPSARAFGCAVFALNPWVLERLALPDAAAYLVFPWCMVGLLRIRPGEWRTLSRAALPLILMGHIGHIEVCLILTLLASLAFLVSGRGEARLLPRALSLGAIALALLAALAVLWVPLFTMVLHSVSYKEAGVHLVFPYEWKALLTPSSDLYLLPVVGGAALCGLLWGRQRTLWAVLAGVALVVLMPLPFLGRAGAEGLFRLTSVAAFYFKPILWLSLTLLSAKGWEVVGGDRVPRALVASCGAAALTACSGLFLFASSPLPVQDLAALPGVTFFLALAGAAAPLLLASRRASKLRVIALFLALAPLAFPLSLNQLTWNRFRLSDHDLGSWMKREHPHGRIASVGFHPSFPIPPNWGQALGIRMGEQNSVFFPNSFLPLFASKNLPMTLVAYDVPQMEAFRQLGTSVFLLSGSDPAGGAPPLNSGRWASAYAVPNSPGRVYFAEAVRALDPGRNLSLQIMGFGDARAAVAVLDDPWGRPIPPVQGCPGGTWQVEFLEDGIHRIVLHTRNPSAGMLVLKDTWYPGWKASVDGAPEPIYRANGCFRGIDVPAGDHKVTLEYSPTRLYGAAAASVAATLALLAAALCRGWNTVRAMV